MPQSCNHVWHGLKIETRFKKFFRRRAFQRRPYYVGQRVWQEVNVIKVDSKAANPSDFEICEQTGARLLLFSYLLLSSTSGRK